MESPAPARGEVLIRVEACGICGTDVEQYRGQLDETLGLQYPLIPGHEPVGIIESIGKD
ncbi:MAG: alcohol dehydrogenase catalytic domain-containing protein, partial [Chloroflexota bacterium]